MNRQPVRGAVNEVMTISPWRDHRHEQRDASGSDVLADQMRSTKLLTSSITRRRPSAAPGGLARGDQGTVHGEPTTMVSLATYPCSSSSKTRARPLGRRPPILPWDDQVERGALRHHFGTSRRRSAGSIIQARNQWLHGAGGLPHVGTAHEVGDEVDTDRDPAQLYCPGRGHVLRGGERLGEVLT